MDKTDGQNNAYLVAFKMPIDIVKANIIDIRDIHDIHTLPSRDRISNNLNNGNHYTKQDNNGKGTQEWALRAIENGHIILNDNDLLDFLEKAKRTAGYFRIHANTLGDRANIDYSHSSSEIYCMFINKGPVDNKPSP